MIPSRLSLPLLALAFFAPLARAGVTFNREVRPILSDKCFACHGMDAKQRKAELRLDTAEGALGKAESGAVAIKPGDVNGSELWARINATDKDEIMPPPKSHKTLSAAEKATLRQWIEEGARYQKHWSFETPVKAAVPVLPAEIVVRNAVDAFLFDRLKREGLAPLPEAEKETLIRRVTFALTGLPPTVEEVAAFLADVAPEAYEKVVDRLLASPRYGEQMARHWLDVARYGDTHGLHLDNERSMWPYRDWVVGAFNRNQPFSQFTIEQLAGDLLPAATPEQLIATGFNRCNVTTGEGGSIDAEWIYRYAVERTATTAQTWMGLSAGCAQCHDHKFDPVSQKEFYQLYAFFHSAADPAMDGNTLLTAPTAKLITAEQTARIAELDARRAAAEMRLAAELEISTYEDPGSIFLPVSAEAERNQAVEDAGRDPAKSLTAWLATREGKDTKGVPAEIAKLLKSVPAAKRTPGQQRQLRDHYLTTECAATKPTLGPLLAEVGQWKKERDDLEKAAPVSFVMRDLDKPRDSFVMLRGAYDKPGEKVARAVPAAFPPLAKTDAPNRLDLARWLVADEHPLTARVTVNRFWQQFFGVGLVKTSADFGSQGQPPSHPELLDWLAVTFRESGWDGKKLVRLLVTSAAFRQSSAAPAGLWQRDPENRLLARGPRFRLDAEEVRDNALAVAGLLDLTMGGKGVKPYQPPNIWEPVGFVGSNTRFYKQDTGNALYRRSLYTFIKRTAPAPFMANFDAPSREQACAVRERSNTPMQALQLMNDVQQIEAARVFAERLMTQGGATPDERIAFAYRTVLARPPAPEETAIVRVAYEQHLATYQKAPEEAAKFIRQGESKPKAGLPEPEVAAWTLVANLVLNLDETVTRN
jgi:Protein of unknown function (DUF1553)/Protein of unknown function (DUF1549)/Planctomycete cytochrome C